MIERVGGTAPPRLAGRNPRAATGFEIAAREADTPAAAMEVASVSLGSMLAMQEAETEAATDREARRHGEDMLRELALLQRDLLGQGATAEGLTRLADLAERARAASDIRLRGVLDAIVVRARVELARHTLG